VRQQWGEDKPSLDGVVDQVRSTENLGFRIMHNAETKYRLYFEPGGSEYAIAKNSKVSRPEVDIEAVRRGDAAEEMYWKNNEWMKGMSQDEVDRRKQAYEEKKEA
jgi:hypothetical protein